MIRIKFKKNDENAFKVFKRIYEKRNVVRCSRMLNSYIYASNKSEMIIVDKNVYLTYRSNLIINTNQPGEEKLELKDVLDWQNLPEQKIKGKQVSSENLRDCFEILRKES